MTVEDAKEAINDLKTRGLTDEQICESLLSMYRDDKLDLDQLEALAKLVGYDLEKGFIEAEKRRLKQSDLSYITGMKLSVIEEIHLIKKIIPSITDEVIKEDLIEALYCLRYALSDETIDYLKEKRDDLRWIIIDKRKEEYNITNKKIKCLSCKYGVVFNPYDTWCLMYDSKPKGILKEEKDCPYYCKTAYKSIIEELNKEE